MTKPSNTLPNDIEKLKELLLCERRLSAEKDSALRQKDLTIKELQNKNQHLLEQFRFAQQRQFGKSSEAHAAQGDLFNEAEQLLDEIAEPEKEDISYTRNKPKRRALPKDLPREVIVHDISDDEKTCDCCGSCAVNYLQDFTGSLQVDGYQGYEQTSAQLSGCWAHARRKFIEAQKAQGNNKTGKAQWAISHIQKLYRIEKMIKDKSAEEKAVIRKE